MAANQSNVDQFLETLASEVTTSKPKIRTRLTKKINEREKIIKQRNNIGRMRDLTMDLETKEEEIRMVQNEIQTLELLIAQADDEVDED